MNRSMNSEQRAGNMRWCILLVLLAFFGFSAGAQQVKSLTLEEAIRLGLGNSKTLRLSQARIDEAISQYDQLADRKYPTGKASYAYNHVEIPTHTLKIGDNDPIHLPSRANAFIGTVAVEETVLDAHRLRYAKEAQDLLVKISRLDSETDRDEVVYAIINAYYNLYKVLQSQKVVDQNLTSADQQLKQSGRFFEQGIVTKNDVLRFELEKSTIAIDSVDLEETRKVVNFDMNVLLGLPESTEIAVTGFADKGSSSKSLATLVDSALNNRQEIKEYDLRTQLADSKLQSIHADQLPIVGVGANLYYINAGGKLVPTGNSFITPITLGATIAWNFDKLWTSKNKIAQAKIERSEALIQKDLSADRVRSEVNRNYQSYLTALERIRIYEAAVAQATENDKILESKYKNNIASVTDRIDADTQLFQTLTHLELAKADAALAWYTVLKSTGTLLQTTSK